MKRAKRNVRGSSKSEPYQLERNKATKLAIEAARRGELTSVRSVEELFVLLNEDEKQK